MKLYYVVWFTIVPAVLIHLSGISPVRAQDIQDPSLKTPEALQIVVETTGFRGPKGFTRVDICTVVDAQSLQFVPQEDAFVAQLQYAVILSDSTGQKVKVKTWTQNISVPDMNAPRQEGAVVREIVGLDLPPKTYRLELLAEDIYSGKTGTFEAWLQVRNFDRKDLSISDLLFATKITPQGEAGKFIKNGWNIVPNVSHRYRVGEPVRVYFEIYNLKRQKDQPAEPLILGYSFTDSSGMQIKKFPSRRIRVSGESFVKTETIETDGLNAGVYFFQVEAFDRGTREHVRQRRAIFLFSDELSEEAQDQLRYFKDIRYIAPSKDLNSYAGLTTEAERMDFLKAFWKKMDPTPGTPLNERLREHMTRIQFADEHFGSEAHKRGSDTDKGRVYIKYGPPDDRDFEQSSENFAGAIEKWTYDRSKRYLFVFQDRRRYGVYELIHSTMPGELYNPNWKESQ